jgi:hypothetical protein
MTETTVSHVPLGQLPTCFRTCLDNIHEISSDLVTVLDVEDFSTKW